MDKINHIINLNTLGFMSGQIKDLIGFDKSMYKFKNEYGELLTNNPHNEKHTHKNENINANLPTDFIVDFSLFGNGSFKEMHHDRGRAIYKKTTIEGKTEIKTQCLLGLVGNSKGDYLFHYTFENAFESIEKLEVLVKMITQKYGPDKVIEYDITPFKFNAVLKVMREYNQTFKRVATKNKRADNGNRKPYSNLERNFGNLKKVFYNLLENHKGSIEDLKVISSYEFLKSFTSFYFDKVPTDYNNMTRLLNLEIQPVITV